MIIHGNVVPIGFKDKFFNGNSSSSWSILKRDRVKFPRVGAFEVYYDMKCIASKLDTGRWPNPMTVV